MDIRLRIFILSISLIVFSSVISMMVKRKLNESNSAFWLAIGFFTLLSGIFPNIVNEAAEFLGIDYQPTLLFLVAIIALLLMLFKNTISLSKAESKINEIAMTVSILKEENEHLTRMLEENLNSDLNKWKVES